MSGNRRCSISQLLLLLLFTLLVGIKQTAFIARYPRLKENISLTKHYYQSKTSKNMYQAIISIKVMIIIMVQEIIVKSQINAI